MTLQPKDWEEEVDIGVNNWLTVDAEGNETILDEDIADLKHDLSERVRKARSQALQEAEEALPEEEKVSPCVNCTNPNNMSDKRCHNCSRGIGRNNGLKEAKQAITKLRDTSNSPKKD